MNTLIEVRPTSMFYPSRLPPPVSTCQIALLSTGLFDIGSFNFFIQLLVIELELKPLGRLKEERSLVLGCFAVPHRYADMKKEQKNDGAWGQNVVALNMCLTHDWRVVSKKN